MTTANCPPMTEFAGFGEQPSWLKELPGIIALPGGLLVANYLLYQTIRSLRKTVEHAETILTTSWFTAMSPEERAHPAAFLEQKVDEIRAGLTRLEPYARKSLVMRFLLNRYQEYLQRYSDLVETVALSADPEMVTLGKELNDVL